VRPHLLFSHQIACARTTFAAHTLYGFARYADDILDDPNLSPDTAPRAARLQELSDQFFARGDHSTDPVLAAVGHTVRRCGISGELFDGFLASMRMDLAIADYPNRAALNPYMKGANSCATPTKT
jgi:15-cis-phytoene synthase